MRRRCSNTNTRPSGTFVLGVGLHTRTNQPAPRVLAPRTTPALQLREQVRSSGGDLTACARVRTPCPQRHRVPLFHLKPRRCAVFRLISHGYVAACGVWTLNTEAITALGLEHAAGTHGRPKPNTRGTKHALATHLEANLGGSASNNAANTHTLKVSLGTTAQKTLVWREGARSRGFVGWSA